MSIKGRRIFPLLSEAREAIIISSSQEFMDKQQQIRASPVNSAQKDFEQKHEAAAGSLEKLRNELEND